MLGNHFDVVEQVRANVVHRVEVFIYVELDVRVPEVILDVAADLVIVACVIGICIFTILFLYAADTDANEANIERVLASSFSYIHVVTDITITLANIEVDRDTIASSGSDAPCVHAPAI